MGQGTVEAIETFLIVMALLKVIGWLTNAKPRD